MAISIFDSIEPKTVFFALMCALMCVQVPVYCHYKVRGKGTAYTVSKCSGSIIFLLTALGSLVFAKTDTYSILIIVAMALSLVGDYLLSRTAAHRLKAGGAAFAAAHICFTAAYIYAAGFKLIEVAVIAALFELELLGAKVFNLKNRGAGAGMAVYIISVTTMAVCAAFMLFAPQLRVEMSRMSIIMTAVGAALFLASDCFWMTYGMIFNNAKASLKIANAVTYFPAQLLIAGALLFR